MANDSVPDDWKVANVVPVYKGGSRRNVATKLVLPVFETIVRDQVIEFLECNEFMQDMDMLILEHMAGK